MKKYLAIVLGALFVLGFAASAFAIHAEIPSETQAVVAAGGTQITLGGELRVRGWWTDNIDFQTLAEPGPNGTVRFPVPGKGALGPGTLASAAWYDERIRLSLDAKVSPNVEGFVQLESNTAQGLNNGPQSSNDVYIWGNFDNKPTTLGILQAWIIYSGQGLLGFPTGMKIGHMPLETGLGQFFDHTKFGDDAIVLFALPTKELEIDLLTIKLAGEGNAFEIPTFGISAPATATSKYNNLDDLDAYVGIVTYKIDDKNTVGANYIYLNDSSLDFSHQNLELTANGNIMGFGYKGSLDIQFGKIGDSKFKGYGILAGLNYMIDPINLRANFGYGTGPDLNSTDIKEFTTYLDNVQHYTLVYEYTVIAASGRVNSGLDNTTYGNVGFDVKPVKDLAVSVDGYYLRATKPLFAGQSKNVGWEVDGKIVYNLAKNLTYQVDAGYLHAGSFYKDALEPEIDVKNPIVLRHMLTLSF